MMMMIAMKTTRTAETAEMLNGQPGCCHKEERLPDVRGGGGGGDIHSDGDDDDNGAEVEFVHPVTAGGSVKFLPPVLISPFSLIFLCFFLLKLLILGEIDGVKFLA